MQYTEFARQPTIAAKGQDVTLKCVVKAFPIPKTAWKKDGELVTKDDRHVITNTDLTIKQVDRSDMGKYSCIAWNRGSAQAKSTLLLITGNCYVFQSDLHGMQWYDGVWLDIANDTRFNIAQNLLLNKPMLQLVD